MYIKSIVIHTLIHIQNMSGVIRDAYNEKHFETVFVGRKILSRSSIGNEKQTQHSLYAAI